MAIDFTSQEKGVLAKLFPGDLLSKVVTLIRDAILASEKFAAAVTTIVAKAIFGVGKAEEIPNALVGMVDEAAKRHSTTMTDEGFCQRLKAALGDPSVFADLCQRLDQRDRAERTATAERRLTVIREGLQSHFGLERPDQVADSLVQLIFSRRVLGGRESTWPEKVSPAIGQIEEEMLQTIEGLVPKRPKKLADLGPFVRLLLIEGITPDDAESVRNALSERDEFAKLVIVKKG